jgi:hypothetical protein
VITGSKFARAWTEGADFTGVDISTAVSLSVRAK